MTETHSSVVNGILQASSFFNAGQGLESSKGVINLEGVDFRKLISEGVHPFETVREFFGYSEQIVAEKLSIACEKYVHIESGECQADADDVIAFCMLFNLLPHQLLAHDCKSIDPAIAEAMMIMIVDSEKYGLSKDVVSKIWSEILEPEILNARTSLTEAKNDLVRSGRYDYPLKPDHTNALTILFLDELLGVDLSLIVSGTDFRRFADGFHSMLRKVNKKLKGSVVQCTRHQSAAIKSFNQMGQCLFDKDWTRVSNQINVVARNSSREGLLHLYRTSPNTFGLDHWPSVLGQSFWEGKLISAAKLHKMHVASLETLINTTLYKNHAEEQLKRYEAQQTELGIWLGKNMHRINPFVNLGVFANRLLPEYVNGRYGQLEQKFNLRPERTLRPSRLMM